MFRSLAFGSLFAAAILLALSAPVLAGGWAVTAVDVLPSELHTGQTYKIGYAIVQHGQTPFTTNDSHVRIRSLGTGETKFFPGRPEGTKGHHVAEVQFPSAGEWAWEIKPGPFEVHKLAPVTVLPAGAPKQAAASSQPAWVASTGNQPGLVALRLGVVTLTIVAAVLFAIQAAPFITPRLRRLKPEAALPPDHAVPS